MSRWRRLVDWWQAWRRGDQRIAPIGTRGRVYARPGEGGPVAAKGKPEATIRARVYRAATGTWEDHGIISGPGKD